MEFCCYLRNTTDKSRTTRFHPSGKTSVHPRLREINLITVSLAISWIFGFPPPQVNEAGLPQSLLTLLERTITQDQGEWVVDYRLRNTSRTGVIITPEEFALKIEGWVSNSRVASHAVPRWSSLMATARVDPTACSDVIIAVDESHRCRERLAILVWAEGRSRFASGSVSKCKDHLKAVTMPAFALPIGPLQPLSLGTGETMHLRLRIVHQHILYGDYDPLLGVRTVELSFGSSVIRDLVPLDREQFLAQPKYAWPEPPEERRDTRHFVSAPDSLYLEADVQDHQSYRYQERPVRYNTKMRLQFWYLIAAGTEGECRVRVGQNKDTPLAWRQLHEASFEEQLKTIGHWTKYERIIQTELEATKLILEFKIVGEIDTGEMWIDDVNFEALGNNSHNGP